MTYLVMKIFSNNCCQKSIDLYNINNGKVEFSERSEAG